MALPTISASSFSGFTNISADTYLSSDFAAYISRGIKKHLRYLLGDQAFIDIDLTTHPAWTALLNGTTYTNSAGDQALADSLTEILKLLIYADWVNEGAVVDSNVGQVMNFNENSSGPYGGLQGAMSVKRLAEAADLWENTCIFIEEFRKVSEDISAADNTDPLNPVLTVASASGKYLEDGDAVTILGVEYAAANVTATTFSVTVATAGLGSSFVGQSASWEPFALVQQALPEIQTGVF